jgi:hypothetical protein
MPIQTRIVLVYKKLSRIVNQIFYFSEDFGSLHRIKQFPDPKIIKYGEFL